MQLANPAALWLLLLLPLLLLQRPAPRARIAIGTQRFWRASPPVSAAASRRRPRADWLTLLQAIFLSFLVLALARPSVPLAGRRVAIIVDLSASMGTREGTGTRLDAAKAKALATLADLPRWTRVHVLGAHALIDDVGDYAAGDPALPRAVRGLNVTDANGTLDDAVKQALMSGPATVYVFSDHTTRQDAGGDARVLWSSVTSPTGSPANNVALTDLTFARAPGRAADVQVLVTAYNAGSTSSDPEVVVSHDGRTVLTQRLHLAARSHASLTATVPDAVGVVTARIADDDARDGDNVRAVVIPTPDSVRVRLVGADFFVQRALRTLPNIVVDAGGAHGQTPAGNADVVVCEACADVPAGHAGVIMVAPASMGGAKAPPLRQPPSSEIPSRGGPLGPPFDTPGTDAEPLTVSAADHPLARSLALDGVTVIGSPIVAPETGGPKGPPLRHPPPSEVPSRGGPKGPPLRREDRTAGATLEGGPEGPPLRQTAASSEIPTEQTVVARAGGRPAIVASDVNGRRVVELRFDPSRSQIALDTSFPILVANAVEWVANTARTPTTIVAGEPLLWAIPTLGTNARVQARGPRDEAVPVTVRAGSLLIADTRTAGIYHLTIDGQSRALAVNPALDEAALQQAAPSSVAIPSAPVERAPQTDAASFLICGALILLAMEWWTRRRRAMAGGRRRGDSSAPSIPWARFRWGR